MVLKVASAVIVVLAAALFVKRLELSVERNGKIEQEFYDMWSCIIDLIAENTISAEEWAKWIEIGTFADERYRCRRGEKALAEKDTCEYLARAVLSKLLKSK